MSRFTRTAATPLKVDFKRNEWDALVKELGQKGLYGTTIERVISNLTISQVRYRLRAAGLSKPRAYRQGNDAEAKRVIREAYARIRRMESIVRDIRSMIHRPNRNRIKALTGR